ncbi:hypothetical protein ACLMJK_009297 [Lecanora helva]
MLGWLTGSSETVAADNGLSYIDEPPETPAPLFAIRAFKTAIFGTPAPRRQALPSTKPPKEEEQKSLDFPILGKETRDICSRDDDQRRNDIHESKPVEKRGSDALASPAKGILLTPGTAANRRKTVSFGEIEREKEAITEAPPQVDTNFKEEPVSKRNGKEQDTQPEEKRLQSTLTKTLIELSKQKKTKDTSPDNSSPEGKKIRRLPSMDFQTDSIMQLNTDTTTDLSQPVSRSGQHWKLEYDQYHRRSNREMKKIIKYGQNVRSYAAKKDAEATKLGERLKRQVAKTAVMEAKLSSLEDELNEVRSQKSNGESNGGRMGGDMLPQIETLNAEKREDGDVISRDHEPQQTLRHNRDQLKEGNVGTNKPVATGANVFAETVGSSSLHTEVESLRKIVKAAEDQTAKLEKENAALKLSLARVKNEMMSYETRRQAREDRMKKREAKHKTAKEECEKKLTKLTAEHEELLRTSVKLPVIDMEAEVQSIQQEADIQDQDNKERTSEVLVNSRNEKENLEPLLDNGQSPRPHISPRKKRLQKPHVDIWTLDSSHNALSSSSANKSPTELPPSSVKRDVQRTLQEIDQNLIPNTQPDPNQTTNPNPPKLYPSPQKPLPIPPRLASATRRMHNRKTTISSPRPSMINLESSPAKLQAADQPLAYSYHEKGSVVTTGRSASMLSRAGGSRTSTLTTERAEAARLRLAGRRERKMGMAGSGNGD